MPYMTIREYSRHRGLALSSVQVAIKSGRIHIAKEEQHGKKIWKFVDSDIADKEWSQNTNVDQQRTPTRREMGISQESSRTANYTEADAEPMFLEGLIPASSPESKSPHISSNENSDQDSVEYLKERARRERISRMNAELDYAEKVGTLVHVSKMRAALFNAGTVVQQNLLTISSRISSGLLAYMNSTLEKKAVNKDEALDEIHIQDILNAEIKIALKGLSDAITAF